ncbi:TIGR03943 family protein [Paenibacillus thermoaerophilus]|nr:TIGR03943 family protein [Paenibacillus thermoaerophilus]TMV15964.1 TIGR03943 family protein [Paenibacillus thermoaerophilus]
MPTPIGAQASSRCCCTVRSESLPGGGSVKSNSLRALHHALRGALLLGFTAYVFLLVKRDSLGLYIAPAMQTYIKWSAIGLYAAWRAWRGRQSHEDCGHLPTRFGGKEAAVYLLFAFPLLLGFLLPDATMGSAMAERKGVNLNSAASVKKNVPAAGTASADANGAGDIAGNSADGPNNAAAGAAQPSTPPQADAAKPEPADTATPGSPSGPAQAGSAGAEPIDAGRFPYDRYTEPFARFAQQLEREERIVVKDDLFIETLTALDLYSEPLKGRTVQLTGFVYKEDGMPDNRLVVSRFTVQCCSADAAPYGILVAWDQAGAIAKDTWVTVTGKLTKLDYNGNSLTAIQAVKIEKTTPPADPYVYPNYEFGA